MVLSEHQPCTGSPTNEPFDYHHMMENIRREEEGLSALGQKTQYKMDYAPEVLETFENKHPENDYWVRFNCPEFTSL